MEGGPTDPRWTPPWIHRAGAVERGRQCPLSRGSPTGSTALRRSGFVAVLYSSIWPRARRSACSALRLSGATYPLARSSWPAESLGGRPIGEGSGVAPGLTRHLRPQQHPRRYRATYGNRQVMAPVQAWFLIVRANRSKGAQTCEPREGAPCTTWLDEGRPYGPAEGCHNDCRAYRREDKPAFETQCEPCSWVNPMGGQLSEGIRATFPWILSLVY